jgi:hypothetical protein
VVSSRLLQHLGLLYVCVVWSNVECITHDELILVRIYVASKVETVIVNLRVTGFAFVSGDFSCLKSGILSV